MSTLKRQYETSPLQGANAAYIEWLYEQYLAEPGSVAPEWQRYFSSLTAEGPDVPHGPIVRAMGQRLRGQAGGELESPITAARACRRARKP